MVGSKFASGTFYWRDFTGWTGNKEVALDQSVFAWYSTPTSLYIYETTSWTYQAYFQTYDLWNVLNITAPGHTWQVPPGGPYHSTAYTLLASTMYTWYTDGTMNPMTLKADAQTIGTHEVGHWLALDHDCTVSTAAVMCIQWIQKTSLAQDDVNGAIYLYP